MEIYLDRYFRDPAALLEAINEQIELYTADKPEADRIATLDETANSVPRVSRLTALAIRLDQFIQDGVMSEQAARVHLGHVTRAGLT